MLTASTLDTLPGPILDLFEEYTQSVLNDIARRLVKTGRVTETAAWQMQRLSESGKVYETALDELARLTGRSDTVLSELFERAGVRTMRFDDAIYRAAGLDPLPLNLSPAMAQTLAAGLQKTKGIMQNLTLTTAVTSQEAFIQAADLAYMQITGGAFGYEDAIKNAIKSAAREGTTVLYPSGRREQLDVAMRRTVLTGVSQTASQLQERRADEMGADLVQTSAHIGARPSHATWQGKIFSRAGNHPKYPDFVSSTGYGTGAGLGGWNCRHSWYPYFEGISADHYKAAELADYADKSVTYRGQEMSVYDATQEQRAIERAIRQAKREAGALEAAGLDATAERAAVRQYQARMREFTKQTGLRRQSWREQVHAGPGEGVRGVAPTKKSVQPTPAAVAAPTTKKTGVQDLAIRDQESPGVADRIRTGADSINRVHATEGMPQYFLSDKDVLGDGSAGFFAPDAVAEGTAPRLDMIAVNRSASDPAATFVHEYGHMVDRRGLVTDKDGWASELAAQSGEGPLGEWWKTVQQSPEYTHLMSIGQDPGAHSWIEEVDGETFKVTPSASYAQYLANPREMWARSYAQFIGRQTGHQYNFEGQGKRYPMAWSDESFQPIEKAIKSVFQRKGWM